MTGDVVQASPRAPVGSPPYLRLLARLADAGVAQPGPPPLERLGGWLDWTHAVALSRALDGTPTASDGAADGDAAEECARMRARLVEEIDKGPDPAATGGGFTPFQQHIQSMQRAMQSATGHLRGHLREQLAAGPPPQARLAEVDAAMEAALSPREHALLAPLPALLGAHFERLRQAAQPADGETEPTPAAPAGNGPPAWMQAFRRELRDLLLAELDLRFQPLEGLLAALRSPRSRTR